MSPTATRARYDSTMEVTVPLGCLPDNHDDSLRWLPHLDRDGIIRRLASLRESAPGYRGDMKELARLLEGVESMTPAQLAGRVFAAMDWTQHNRGYGVVESQLQVIALNLKNLG